MSDLLAARDPLSRAARLTCWSSKVEPQPLAGGITNHNFLVTDHGEKFVVRIGEDIPVHGVWRWFELAVSRAAHEVGLSPEIVHAEPGALVMRHIDGRTLAARDIKEHATLARILPLLRTAHRELPNFLHGPKLLFWVFQVIRDYAKVLREGQSHWLPQLDGLLAQARQLEAHVGQVDIVFGHNDLLAANFLDDGKRLWLVDWEYAGFNSPLFDLANLCSNSEVAPSERDWLLATYFEQPLDEPRRRSFHAMLSASLLREAMWGMVSEIHSQLAFDYRRYSEDYLQRFHSAYAESA